MVKLNVIKSQRTILAEVQKEMAQPRMAASVRNNMEIFMIEKFREGTLLHNPETKEDGLVTRVYQRDRQTMYEVWVPVKPDTWLSAAYLKGPGGLTVEIEQLLKRT
jgi:hypothetical protein